MEYPNGGALFQNLVKKNPKAPDYRGDILLDLDALGIGGGKVKLSLAGWKKVSAKGTTFLSLKVSEEREKQERPVQAADSSDEDVPF